MKDYLWIIIAGTFALLAFVFFMLTISNSTSLIKKLKKSKLNIIVNLIVLSIGIGNLVVIVYLLQEIREQIDRFTAI